MDCPSCSWGGVTVPVRSTDKWSKYYATVWILQGYSCEQRLLFLPVFVPVADALYATIKK